MRALVPFLLCAGLVAQSPGGLPPGHAVFSHLRVPASPVGAVGGVSILDVRAGVASLLAPLPAALVGSAASPFSGANAVLVRDTDGAIFVGPLLYGPGQPMALFRLDVNGASVAATTTYPLGTGSSSWAFCSIDQMDWLPDGRIVFLQRGIAGWGSDLGILDPASGAVTRVPTGITNNGRNGLALSRDGVTAYVGTLNPSHIWAVPLAGPPPTAPLTTLPNGDYQLAVDHRGDVYAALFSDLYRVDPSTGAVAFVAAMAAPNAMGIDRVTGHPFVLSISGTSLVAYDVATNPPAPSVVATLPGREASGVAVRSLLYPYGSAAPASNSQTWRWQGNPGGAPVIGNTAFSLTLDTSPGNVLGLVVIGLRDAPSRPFPPLATNVLLDTNQVIYSRFLAPGAVATVPLGIPAGLQPMDLYAQAFQDSVGTFVGSAGLAIHVR